MCVHVLRGRFGVGRMASVAIMRTELDSAGLRAAAGSSDAKQARRLLALAMVLDGHLRLLAAQAGGMDRQTLRDWVHRYGAHGVEGLRGISSKGCTPALSAEQMQELEGLVLAGPDLKQDGGVRWRCVGLRADQGAVRGGTARAHGGRTAA